MKAMFHDTKHHTQFKQTLNWCSSWTPYWEWWRWFHPNSSNLHRTFQLHNCLHRV